MQDEAKLSEEETLQIAGFYLKGGDVAAAKACLKAASERTPKSAKPQLGLSEIMLA